MEPKEQELLSLFQERLVDQLELNDLLKHLVASFHENDRQAILRLNERPREVQVEGLLNTLKKYRDGLRNLVKSLLLSNKHDVLTREILGDDNFDVYDIDDLLEDLGDSLSEVQVLKLELLKERKKYGSTKRELEEVKSNRNSLVFSDYDSSYCSGFDSSDTDTMTGLLLRELEEEKKRREEAEYVKSCQEEELIHLSKKNSELEESQSLLLRQFKSLEDISVIKNEISHKRFPWKAASVADLCLRECSYEQTLTKCRSEDSLYKVSVNEYNNTGVLALAEKVSNLEMQLTEEKEKREISEIDISQLESENKYLQFELEDTRCQLLEMSQHDITHESMSFDEDMWADQDDLDDQDDQDEYGDIGIVTSELYTNTCDRFSLGRGISCPALNHNNVKLRRRSNTTPQEQQRMRRPFSYHGNTDISNIWLNRNVEHYEMDNYDHEIEKHPNPRDTDFKYVLRRLKLKTWNLYHDIVMGSAELKVLGNRVRRLAPWNTYI